MGQTRPAARRSASLLGPVIPQRSPLCVLSEPGEPWLKWGCPIQGCGHRVIIPHELEGHAAAEHPGWVARHELLQPYPNQLERVVYRQVEAPPSDP